MHQGHMHFNALEGGGARYKATWGREVVCMSVAPSGSICTCLAAGSGRPMRWQGWERHTLERCAWSQFRALGLAAAFATAHQRYMPLATAGTCRLPQLLTTAHQVHANGSDTAVTYTVGKERLLIRGGGMRMPSYVCVCVCASACACECVCMRACTRTCACEMCTCFCVSPALAPLLLCRPPPSPSLSVPLCHAALSLSKYPGHKPLHQMAHACTCKCTWTHVHCLVCRRCPCARWPPGTRPQACAAGKLSLPCLDTSGPPLQDTAEAALSRHSRGRLF